MAVKLKTGNGLVCYRLHTAPCSVSLGIGRNRVAWDVTTAEDIIEIEFGSSSDIDRLIQILESLSQSMTDLEQLTTCA